MARWDSITSTAPERCWINWSTLALAAVARACAPWASCSAAAAWARACSACRSCSSRRTSAASSSAFAARNSTMALFLPRVTVCMDSSFSVISPRSRELRMTSSSAMSPPSVYTRRAKPPRASLSSSIFCRIASISPLVRSTSASAAASAAAAAVSAWAAAPAAACAAASSELAPGNWASACSRACWAAKTWPESDSSWSPEFASWLATSAAFIPLTTTSSPGSAPAGAIVARAIELTANAASDVSAFDRTRDIRPPRPGDRNPCRQPEDRPRRCCSSAINHPRTTSATWPLCQ